MDTSLSNPSKDFIVIKKRFHTLKGTNQMMYNFNLFSVSYGFLDVDFALYMQMIGM